MSCPTCADDMAIPVTPHNYADITAIKMIQYMCNKYRISINTSKTKVVRYNFSKKHINNTLLYNNKEIEEVEEETHIGVIQSSKDVYQKRVDKAILNSTRALYSLFGSGLHGKNGLNFVAIRKIWKSYVLPRLLYGSEVWILPNKFVKVLEQFQRKKLKELMDLPPRSSNYACLGLAGILPIEAEYHKRVLMFYRSLLSQQNSIEREIALRQLAMKNEESSSWFIFVSKLLVLYKLPNAFNLWENPPGKMSWKKLVKATVLKYWQDMSCQSVQNLTSLRYLSESTLGMSDSADVYKTCRGDIVETKKANIKVKLMMGVIRLKTVEVIINKGAHQNAICSLCGEEDETRLHFVLICKTLSNVRDLYLNRLGTFISEDSIQRLTDDKDMFLQLLLDAQHERLKWLELNYTDIKEIEDISRNLIYSLYCKRIKLLL